jgi:Tfp pilus assembly protein PilN
MSGIAKRGISVMINLLPPDMIVGYRYARRNVVLRNWVIIFVIAFVGLGAIATYGLLTIHQSTISNNSQIATTEALFQKEKFSQTQNQVQDISNSFKLVVKVLSQEVLFSQLLKQIAQLVPANANLTGLNINQTQGGIDITAETTDYATATQLQVNLASPNNKIFSKADIVSITCSSTNASNAAYPCSVDIRALFAAKNPFLFINSPEVNP